MRLLFCVLYFGGQKPSSWQLQVIYCDEPLRLEMLRSSATPRHRETVLPKGIFWAFKH